MGLHNEIVYVLSTIIAIVIVITFIISSLSPIFYANNTSSSMLKVNLGDLAKKISFYYIEYLPPTFIRLLKSVELDEVVKQLDFDNVALERSLVFIHSEKVVKNLSKYTELLVKILSICKKYAVAYLNIDPKIGGLEAIDSYSAILKALGYIGVEPVIPLSPNQPINDDKLGIGLIHPVLESTDMVVFTADPLD